MSSLIGGQNKSRMENAESEAARHLAKLNIVWSGRPASISPEEIQRSASSAAPTTEQSVNPASLSEHGVAKPNPISLGLEAQTDNIISSTSAILQGIFFSHTQLCPARRSTLYGLATEATTPPLMEYWKVPDGMGAFFYGVTIRYPASSLAVWWVSGASGLQTLSTNCLPVY